MDNYLNSYTEMISLRGLADRTRICYKTYIKVYLSYLQDILAKKPEEVSWQELRDFINWLKDFRNLSDRTINHVISQLRFFCIYVLHEKWDSSQLPTRKFDTYLPFVPTQSEVKEFISSITDLKVKAMVTLMYSSGLRIGEVCNLKYDDISRGSMRIHIHHSKNREARFATLSKTALDTLTEYWFKYDKPIGYLFPKQRNKDLPIDTFYLSRNIHNHEKELGWPKRFTCHSFRHAFGTHLYENGVDILVIKELLGHKSLSSTMIYVHLASNRYSDIVNPLDKLFEV